MKNNKTIHVIYPYMMILFVSLFIMAPQISNHALIFGWDSIFHYNRFYDAMMQIKEGNFSPMMSLYGWPHSGRGRIVNGVYGPGFAYFSGLLMLITGSVFKFQIAMGTFISFMSGAFIYTFSRKFAYSVKLCLAFGIMYMLSGNAMMWITQNTMTGSGSAFFPLILFPIFDLFNDEKRPVHVIKLASIIALLIQIHELTAFSAVIVYGISAIYYLIVNHYHDFRRTLMKWVEAAILFLLLTLNFWLDLFELLKKNTILQPLKYENAMGGTFFSLVKLGNGGFGTQLLVSFVSVAVFLSLIYVWDNKLSNILFRNLLITGVLFLILSLPILPWNWIVAHFSATDTIQFPHRFANIALVLLISAVISIISTLSVDKQKIIKALLGISIIILFGSHLSNLNNYSQNYVQATSAKQIMSMAGSVTNIDVNSLKKAWSSDNEVSGIKTFFKGNFDYLPTNVDTKKMATVTYEDTNKSYFHSENVIVKRGALVVKGYHATKGRIEVPIVKYANSLVYVNNRLMSSKKTSINNVGKLTIIDVPGGNYHIKVKYRMNNLTILGWVLTIVSWLLIMAYGIFKLFNYVLVLKRTETF